jgi:Uma2 family endonuclease
MGFTWNDICDDPQLQALPYKLELNGDGEIIVNAVRVIHAFYVEMIQRRLRELRPDGFTPPEFPVQTGDGVRSPDVVWISAARKKRTLLENTASIAPEICIEVMSAGNSMRKMLEKRDLYLAAGAIEFWVCGQEGAMRFYTADGELETSAFIPGFPRTIDVMNDPAV